MGLTGTARRGGVQGPLTAASPAGPGEPSGPGWVELQLVVSPRPGGSQVPLRRTGCGGGRAKVLERDDRFRGDLDGTRTTRGGWTGDTAREHRRATAAHVTTARLSDSCAQVSQGPDTQVGEDEDVVYISEMAEGTQMED